MKRKFTAIRNHVNPPPLSPEFVKQYNRKWEFFGQRNISRYPEVYSKINAIKSVNYIPEVVYYKVVQPTLNNKAYSLAYADKNFYEQFLDGYSNLFPVTVLRSIEGRLFDKNYVFLKDFETAFGTIAQDKAYILKSSAETSGGTGVFELKIRNDGIMLGSHLMGIEEIKKFTVEKFRGSYVLQQKIVQHPWYAGFNESSVNTVRIVTYRSVKDESIAVLHTVLRFGQKGSLVDNQAAGGLTCGIDNEGRPGRFAVNKIGHRFDDNQTLKTKSTQIAPGWETMKQIALDIAAKYHYHRVLGFDFCLDVNGNVRLLEINCKNLEINFIQMNNGPLFDEYTGEVIDFCKQHKKSVFIHFYI